MITHRFTAPILVENLVMPPSVFVPLLIVISITVSLTPAEWLVLLSCAVFKLRISFSAKCGKVSCCLKMFLYIGSRIKFHND